jgi:hypothetical protein
MLTYTGTGSPHGIAHGLGVPPKFVLVKLRETRDWMIWHQDLGPTDVMASFGTGGKSTQNAFNSTAPDATNFFVGNTIETNENGGRYVAYVWSEVPGFSKFGSFTGNGADDGPFVYCGFKPRWVLAKCTNVSTNWYIFDSTRSPDNVSDEWLPANLANAEQAQRVADIVSNGFKIRNGGTEFDASGGIFIYAAFAEMPFKYSLAH